MKVRITKARKKSYWHANHIGELFDVQQAEWTRHSNFTKRKMQRRYSRADNPSYVILKSDCEVISK